MTPEEFVKKLQNKALEIERYAILEFPNMAGNITLRFINGNFRAQGFQGTTFKKWKPSKGTTLVKTGTLRSATYYTTQTGQVTIINPIPYAKVHNEGFKGEVTVKSHTRNRYSKAKIGTGKFTQKSKERKKTVTFKSGETTVKSHTRKVNIPQRQFIPTQDSPSPVLNNAITRELTKDLKKIIS
uniref:Tail morphogenesis protein n=1 Tax=Myoviridae sp. ctOoC8 TaxID=2823542 RepID=A0A8S5L683_9CAUD|nr:MAG TPA: tail morphogenesis protein [Myoviridae sp. ctOoC8]